MSFWKQALLSLVVLVVAAALWVRFYPGAHDILAKYDLEWMSAAVANAPDDGETQRRETASEDGRGANAGPRTAVVTSPVDTATINDRLTAIGTGRANQTVTVLPFSTGRIVSYEVESGQRVSAGDVIARLDSDSEQIAFDRAEVAIADARSRLERINTLRSSNTASAVQVTEAELAVRNAELALREAELDLERRAIRAPIGGVVGILPINVGNYVTTQTEIATIDDRSEIIVDFWVPERFSGQIEVGTPLAAALVSRPDSTFSGQVSAIDNRVDPASRTLRVQARIDNETDALRAGMAFRVEIRFPGDTYPTVDPLAVQWGTEGAFVWTVRDGRAERTMVRIIQRNTESVLVDAALSPGEEVVTQGIHAVRDGAPVMIARNARPDASNTLAPAQDGAASGT
ncbi:MAG: efflux RND transporter periplasmic adaptor subunit [Rhizobiaceae bacterium]|nr:efflux RND transporter periplasmic adaptor subunit [Rhizobiaceae bacterium]MCV0406844.1 efflux RND transporter periplasmic adaptor subunit [Rhizobiaceae bacterium]